MWTRELLHSFRTGSANSCARGPVVLESRNLETSQVATSIKLLASPWPVLPVLHVDGAAHHQCFLDDGETHEPGSGSKSGPDLLTNPRLPKPCTFQYLPSALSERSSRTYFWPWTVAGALCVDHRLPRCVSRYGMPHPRSAW